MSRLVNYDFIDKAVEDIKNVYYVDDNGRNRYFKYINFEQLTESQWKQRYPEKDIKQSIHVIDDVEIYGNIYKTLTVITCIEDEIRDYNIDTIPINKKSFKNIHYGKIDYDNSIIKFGKYRGRTFKTISLEDLNYLKWIVDNATTDEGTIKICKYWIDKQEDDGNRVYVSMPTL